MIDQRLSEYDVVAAGHRNLTNEPLVSSDGVSVTRWTNQGGPQTAAPGALDVVVCAGLGTPPEAWPTLLAQPTRYRLVGTYWRGTQGSPRPAATPTVADHVRDAIAAMDSMGMERAVFAGWSMGVNIAFEAAVRHPDRVRAVLGVAGVPGNSFGSVYGPIPVPRRWRRPLGMLTSRTLALAGPGLGVLARTVPVRVTASVARHSRLTKPTGSKPYLEATLAVMLRHDLAWYFRLAESGARHERVDLAAVRQPATLIAGSYDLLTSAAHMAEAALELPDCEFVQLPASHFLSMEYPERCERELDVLANRARTKAEYPAAVPD